MLSQTQELIYPNIESSMFTYG